MAAESRGAIRVRVEQHDLDSDTLRAIATATGGRYFAAHTSNDLVVVYDEIDALERVARTERPKPRRAPRPEPFLIAASSLIALEILLARVLWRTIP
jgi:Ca-activated chloride channel family protein